MIFNMTGGGSGGAGGGAILVVSCPANVTVTASKDDKSYTKNSGSLGSATFRGLATGEWTVTIEGNGQTATKNITITADYAITMAFFTAYINITYPANSTCTVKTSGGVTVASDTNTGSSAKTWTVTVDTKGDYIVTATSTIDSSKTKSRTVSITTDGQSESVELRYQFMLFDNGYANQSLTGEYTKNGNTNLSVDTTIRYSEYSSNPTGGKGTFTKSIDITGYESLTFYITVNTSTDGIALGVFKSRDSTDAINAYAYTQANSGLTGVIKVDISELSGAIGYIGGTTHIRTGGVANGNVTISKIWLE